jgi:hypothetical protein
MNYRRDFDPTPQDGAPTMAAPAAGQQPGAWAQQAPYSEPGAYPSYVQQPGGMHHQQLPPPYGQQVPVASPSPLPVYKRPGVVFGAAAVAAVAAVGALLATWVSHDDVSTTPVNNMGTPSQQVQLPLVPVVPAPPLAPPPSQSVVVLQPAPRQQAPRQQAPIPRVAPSNPSGVAPAPVSPSSPVHEPNPNPNPNPEQKQDPDPEQKQTPGDPEQKQTPGDPKDPETGADPRGKQTPPDHNPGDPENPTPDDLLCHPNPPGCTGNQKAPAPAP